MNEKGDLGRHEIVTVNEAYRTICGRVVSKQIIQELNEKTKAITVYSLPGAVSTDQSSSVSSLTSYNSSMINTQQSLKSRFVPIQSSNRK